MQQRAKRVAVVPGDDAAPEAVYATLDVLKAMELPVEWVVLPDGETLARTMPREDSERLIREAADSCDTVLFGATSSKTGGVGYFRWGKQTYANVRPVRWRPGFRSPLRAPEGIDYVIVRENIEDLYLGLEGDLRTLLDSGLDLTPRHRPAATRSRC
jgi:isocitrate/isopropylmalate dehydrogenase